MTDKITLDYRECICRFDGMLCTVDVTCPIHRAYGFTRDDVKLLSSVCHLACRELRADEIAALESLASRIEALLPPREVV